MTTSLQDFPSISRLIAELNGDRPGVSLFDIVSTQCCWNVLPRALNAQEGAQTLLFSGGSGDEVNAAYTASAGVDYKLKRQIPSKDSLRVSWRETKTQRFEILCESGPGFGVTFVRAFVIRGDARFPVWGDPHPVKVGDVYWRAIESRSLWNFTCDDVPLEAVIARQKSQAIFAARMWLATSINWSSEVLSGGWPSSVKEVGNRLGLITDQNHTAW